MGALLDRLTLQNNAYAVERSGDGFVLIADDRHREEFSNLVRELLNRPTDEFVILPVTDGGTGYSRAVILPF